MKKLSLIAIFIAGVIAGVLVFKNSSQAPNTQDSSNSNQTSTTVDTSNIVDKSNQGLTEFPKDVLKMTNVTVLYLQNNKLSGSMPGEIRFLTNLQVLDASNNVMTGVPAEIGQLSKLVTLNLANNKLTGLPNELGNLKQLKTLDLRGNNASAQDVQKIKESLPNTTILL